jgi:predicted alpha/beta-fold hydrolase
MMHNGFRPAWWLPGPHFQTIGARLLRPRGGVRFERERLELPDGDFLDLDWTMGLTDRRTSGPSAPLALVLHGLEGSARSTYAIQLYRELAAKGVDAVGLNFRSCSGEPNRLPRLYHSGETEDLRYVLRLVRERFPGRVLGAAGFSLGGNVLLKYLGEEGERARHLLRAAAAVSVPFDLAAGADHIQRGFSRLYLRFLVRKLRRKVSAKRRLLESRIDVPRVLRSHTFWDFDDAGTAPLHGFASAADYYQRSSSAQFLDDVRVPTLLLHALDDPFLGPDAVPHPETVIARNPHLELVVTPHGGHVGFVSGQPWRPVFWGERTAAGWLGRRLMNRGTEARRH